MKKKANQSSSFCLRLFTLVTLLTLLVGQWEVLQAVAWATMLVNNLRTTSLPQAVERTFDGKHPCPICRAIAAGKKSEPKSTTTAKFTRLDFLPGDRGLFVFSIGDPDLIRTLVVQFHSTDRQPPIPPPPRAFCA